MKKIIFNDKYGLTAEVLAGRKTMTRRIVPEGTPLGNWSETVKHSKYQEGEEVAIAQSYEDIYLDKTFPNKGGVIIRKFNKLGKGHIIEHDAGWNNKMFVKADLMPHRICITGVRVERLQDISVEECRKEGIKIRDHKMVSGLMFSKRMAYWMTPIEAFATLIDKISGKGTWKSNPWVFVYEFKLIK